MTREKNMEQHHDHEKEKEKSFLAARESIAGLSQEQIDATLKNDPNYEKARDVEAPCVIVCMDEGCAMKVGSLNEQPVLAIAGSGCLCEAENKDERAKKLAKALFKYAQDRGLKKLILTAHDGCGAGGLAHKRDHAGEAAASATTDREVVDLLLLVEDHFKGLSNYEIDLEFRNISKDNMARPASFHNAVAAMWDTRSDRFFNPKLLEDFPQTFLIHELYDDEGDPVTSPFAQLQVACNIAFGDHGFGAQTDTRDFGFSPEYPFTIILVGSKEELPVKRKQLEDFLKKHSAIQKNIDHKFIRIVEHVV